MSCFGAFISLVKFLKESHNAFTSSSSLLFHSSPNLSLMTRCSLRTDDTVADSLSHLGLSSLNDRIPTLEVSVHSVSLQLFFVSTISETRRFLLSSTLMAHQVIGVSWMVKQEAKEDYKGGILA